ncbi:MAG: outer membrane beta-barrel protein [Acidobacteriaceae bacterium]|jgi:hypothetical protein|nr:outer membrane beta-barrel protein [Acidobacteriaceae bacterium]
MPESLAHRIAIAGHAILWSLFLLMSTAAWAQGVAGSSVDIAVNAGTSNISGNDTGYHPEYGTSLGYNFTPHLGIFAEYNYLSLGSYQVAASSSYANFSLSGNYQWVGGSARYTPFHAARIVPYIAGGGGYARAAAAASIIGQNASASATNGSNGEYVSAGGGISVFAGRNWGIRPEVRWDRQFYGNVNNSTLTVTDVRGTLSLFYQWHRPYRYY